MNILATNDDGIHSEGLWLLVRELAKVASVTVVAPDGERSAIGTAVSLFQPLHVVEAESPVDGVTAYAVDGSPSDCVLLALGKIAENSIDMVVSGINSNLNLGEDAFISGTVGAALQGYFRGFPAIAVSAPPDSLTGLQTAAVTVAALAPKLAAALPGKVLLNVNVPGLPPQEIAGAAVTRLARASHINTVEEENHGSRQQYRLVRERLSEAGSQGTDIRAVERGIVSVTPLFTSLQDKPPQRLLQKLCAGLLEDIRTGTA
jgi:5'-nucleotidase